MPTVRDQFKWWRVSRLAERLGNGEASPTFFRPYVQVEANDGGARVNAREKLWMGPYIETTVRVTRDEDYGHVSYITATQVDASGATEHFRGYPGGIEERGLSVGALCHVLGAAVEASEHAKQSQ